MEVLIFWDSLRKDVFISYTAQDRDRVVEPLIDAFKKANISYWYDQAEIQFGDNITQKIDLGLKNSRCVIVIISKSSILSKNVQQEINLALQQEQSSNATKILPLIITSNTKDKNEILTQSPWLQNKAYLAWNDNPTDIVNTLLFLLDKNPIVFPDRKPLENSSEQTASQNQKQLESISVNNSQTTRTNILHLSDLHFGTLEQAQIWSNQLVEDLKYNLNIQTIDTLIVSGDIASKSTPDEYEAAEKFLDYFRQDFPLQPEQIIIVPGNHDLNWQKSQDAYTPMRRNNYDGRTISINDEIKPDPNYAIDDGGAYVAKQDEDKYTERFLFFSDFYESIKRQTYSLEYNRQYTISYFSDRKLLILGLNSAWQIDHHYQNRASINMNALSNALTKIHNNSEYGECLKIAVWHHPLDRKGNDRIANQDFMELLAANGFRLVLNGHIHKAENDQYHYAMNISGKKIDRISAGFFGAFTRELVTGTPRQYNLLKLEDNQITVETRRREQENGAWNADARWSQGYQNNPLPRYVIQLKGKVKSMNKVLTVDDIIQLEYATHNLFVQISSVAGRKSILFNAGIDRYFISSLDFNLNSREFTTMLVANSINYSVSSRSPDYHPLMALLNYFLQRSQQYNLDDETINLFNRIYSIGQNNLNNISFKSNNRAQSSNSETNNQLSSYLKSISQNLKNEGCLLPETNVSYDNKQFELVGKITNFELSFGVLNMRGDAFFIFSHFDSINIKILRRYAGLCLQYATEKSTSSSAGQIINAKVPSNTCFAIAIVDNLNEDTKNTIQTENPFDVDTDTLWYKVPVVYSLNEQKLYYYDRPSSFWENFKGEIVWKKLRDIIENILNP